MTPYRVEYRIQASDGRWVWLEDQASVVRDAHGHPLLWQGVLVDITAAKAAEEALREAESRFRGLFEGIADAILVTDTDGRYLDANPAATALLGYSHEELLTMGVTNLVADSSEWTTREYTRYPPTPGLIHHSDRGVQYASGDYVARLEGIDARISMAAVGTPYENAKAESFFKTLKCEEVYLKDYRTFEEVERHIGHFIEDVFNTKRLHSSLGYLPPAEFEAIHERRSR